MPRVLSVCLGLLFLGIMPFQIVEAEDELDDSLRDKQERLITMMNMDVKKLSEVKITLDKVFNVFDGLIKARKVSVATGVEQETHLAPAVTTVITSQDIEAMGARDLNEVLASVPGLHVSYYDVNYNPIYVLRGIYSSNNPEILLLINGIPIKDLEGGNRSEAWGGMPVQMISRVEIIRGPGSALYGADALSGVINIITKQADDIGGLEMGMRAGSYHTHDAWLLYGGKHREWEMALGLEVFDSNGYDGIIEVDAQSFYDREFGTDASHAPGPVQLEGKGVDARLDLAYGRWRWRAGYQGRRDLGGGAGASLDPEAEWEDDRINTDLTYQNADLFQHWTVQGQLSYRDLEPEIKRIHLFPPGAFNGLYPEGIMMRTRIKERQTRLEMSGFYDGLDRHLIRIGGGFSYEEMSEVAYATNRGLDAEGNPIPPGSPMIDLTGTQGSLYPEEIRKNRFIYVQDTWNFAPDWSLTAGLRHDRYSDFGGTTNPRLALVWRARPDLTAKLLYGRAFRAPSFRELYIRNNNIQQGNPDLDPETLHMGELALDWFAREDLHLSLNFYRFTLRDKIRAQALDRTSLRYENAASWQGHGLESELRWKVSNNSSLLLNYALAHTTLENDDLDIGHYPRHQVYLRGDWMFHPHWFLDLQFHWIGERERPIYRDDFRPPVAGYWLTDLVLRYKNIQRKGWNIAAGVRNLFDREARAPSGINTPHDLPLPGRNWFVELRHDF